MSPESKKSSKRAKKPINIEIGRRIKLARKHANLTQEELADAIEICPQHMSNIERGINGVSIETLILICYELHVSSDYLLLGISLDPEEDTLGKRFSYLSIQEQQNVINGINTLHDIMQCMVSNNAFVPKNDGDEKHFH